MKAWMIVFSMVALLGMTTLADAKGNGKKDHGVRGTIATVNANNNTFTMTVGKKNATQTITVNCTNATITIDGSASAFASLASGQKVTVIGTQNGDTIAATAITEKTPKKKNKNA